ncbi:MAG: aldose 1-epimerase family protein [Planctomycetota bacterium]|jgi:hypothetical protein
MANRVWTLTDVDEDVYVEQAAISPDDVEGPAAGYSVTKRTLCGGLRHGVDVIEVDNGAFRFVVLPTRGMGIWHARMGNVQLGWKSPVKGPVHPAFVPLSEASGLGWLDGFDELLVRCGLESNGAPEFNDDGTLRYGLHGKIANVPAHKVEVTVDGDDTVTNLSAEPGELELLYHTNFGVPLLDPGSKAVLPVRKMAPRDAVAVENLSEWDTYGHETPGSSEAVFFFELAADVDGNTRALLHNAAGTAGVSLLFNADQLPYFTLWKNRQAAADGYVTGLEPAINFPNVKSFEKEKGRVAVLQPGESRTFRLELEAHGDAAGVAVAAQAVADLQQGISPEILDQPNPDWSAG